MVSECSHENEEQVLDWHPVYEATYDEEGEVISSKVLEIVEINFQCRRCREQRSEVKTLW